MVAIGVDIGGTHISAACVAYNELLKETYLRAAVDPSADARTILDSWASLINTVIGLTSADEPVSSIGVAMPGPFDYRNGISMITGLDKYESLYGVNVREALRQRLTYSGPICFENDAACFGIGVARGDRMDQYRRLIALTLGTGLGACFINDTKPLTSGIGVPPNGYLYNI